MHELSFYSSTYSAARQQFRQYAYQKGGQLYALPVDESQGLFIDIALWPGASDTLLLHTSGIHGVEAFPGSAVQCAFLDEFVPDQLQRSGLALVHCVNPWGMQRLRRWNAENVDLNRNFLPQFDAPPDNPAYDKIASFLNPVTPRQRSAFSFQAAKLLIRHGLARLQQAVAQGQYQHPRGLFYGGNQRTTEAEQLFGFFRQHITSYDYIRGLDFHTGLGKYGQSAFYLEAEFGEDDRREIEALLAEPLIHARPGKKQSYRTQGGFIAALRQLVSPSELLMVTQEIGTVGPIRILKALREENFAFHHAPERLPEAGQRVKRAFCPEGDAWKVKAVRAGVQALQRLVATTATTSDARSAS